MGKRTLQYPTGSFQSKTPEGKNTVLKKLWLQTGVLSSGCVWEPCGRRNWESLCHLTSLLSNLLDYLIYYLSAGMHFSRLLCYPGIFTKRDFVLLSTGAIQTLEERFSLSRDWWVIYSAQLFIQFTLIHSINIWHLLCDWSSKSFYSNVVIQTANVK